MKSQISSEELFMQLPADMMETLDKDELMWVKGGKVVPPSVRNDGVGCGCSGEVENNGTGCGCS